MKNKYVMYLTGYVNGDNFKQFITEINSIPEDLDIDLYLTTEGGEMPSYYCLLDVINRLSKRITLIASGAIMSCGFDLFFKSNAANKRILPYTMGMTHVVKIEGILTSNGHFSDEPQKTQLSQMHSDNLSAITYLKELGLNSKEIKIFKSKKECFFGTKRLNELLELQNKSKTISKK